MVRSSRARWPGRRTLGPFLSALALLLWTFLAADAQVFKLQAGASTLYGAEGGSIGVQAPNYTSQFGAGFLNGRFQLGGQVRTKLFGNTLTAGDDIINLDLPTDVFGDTHYFIARGLGVRRSSGNNRMYIFAGATSAGFSTPFFMAARSDAPLAAAFMDRSLTPTLRLVSRNLYSSKKTSIQALEWSPRTWLKSSVAAGIGRDQRYASTSFSIERETISARASYVSAGNQFERIQVPMPVTSELEKGNFTLTYRPSKAFNFTAGHENILQPPFRNQATIRASVNELYTGFNLARFSFGGGLFDSKILNHRTLGTNLFVMRNLTQRVRLTGNFFQSRPDTGGAFSTFTGSIRTVITQKLSLTEDVTNSNGQTSFATGGEIVTNRFNVLLNYQTVYVPLRIQNPFEQVLGLNARVNLVGNMQLMAASYVDPTGHMRYTFGLSTFLYHFGGGAYAGANASYRFPKYVIKGVVTDGDGDPIEGAALHIGTQVAYSDGTGQFMVREDKHGPFTIEVAFEEFITAGRFETVQLPSSVTAETEDRAELTRVVLRRVRIQPGNQR